MIDVSVDDALASLAAAADVARQAYLAALAANPDADLSQLYVKEMAAAAAWSAAENKALSDDPRVGPAQAELDAATQNIRASLGSITDVVKWASLLDNLVQLATRLGAFFA